MQYIVNNFEAYAMVKQRLRPLALKATADERTEKLRGDIAPLRARAPVRHDAGVRDVAEAVGVELADEPGPEHPDPDRADVDHQ
jgi:hypothetical protein